MLKAKVRTPRRYIEQADQVALFSWSALASLRHPELRLLYAVPNFARLKSARDGARRKAEGMKPGVWDIHLPVARGGFIGLWVEMKTDSGKLSPKQKAWGEMVAAEGHAVRICRSTDHARREIEAYLALPKPRGLDTANGGE